MLFCQTELYVHCGRGVYSEQVCVHILVKFYLAEGSCFDNFGNRVATDQL